MDNGFTVSTTLELDGSALDDRSISIETGDMGKLTFSGSGTSGPIGAWDDVTPSANEEAHGTAVAGTQARNADVEAEPIVFTAVVTSNNPIRFGTTP